jgi:uncharacterized protein YaaN involved in tellurite resistance
MSDQQNTAVATVDVKSLTKPEISKALEFAKVIDPSNTGNLLQYGTSATQKIGSLADTMLTQIRNKDSGEVGEALSNLMFKVKDVDVSGFTKDHKGLLTNLKNKVEHFMSKYQKLESQIDDIVRQLEKSKMQMITDVNMLDQLYKQNLDYMHNLDLFIAGGQMRLEELKTKILPQYEAKAKETNAPEDAQALNDFNNFINQVEKKIYDLQLSRMISIQTAPQVKLIQNGDQILVNKIQSSISTTIPLWKSQIVIAISIFRQKKAMGVEKAVTDATNDLMKRNAELLHQGTVEVAKENERGIVDIETLQATNENLIATIQDCLTIQEEGKQKRIAAQQTLTQLESDLKAKLSQARGTAA